ncbi:hypothetical protein EDC01DRAFT_628551 [Geopyxis carbonaria]|nr:hypothetical protein EDC01DRAFT_628551 [Geopyxis carbonaria]
MTETKSTSPLSAQEQARIRRERRQAKVSQAGTSRLNRITSTQGSGFRSEEPIESPTTLSKPGSPPSLTGSSSTPDPPDIDISVADHAHAYPSLSRGAISAEDELRQAMMMDSLFRQPVPGAASSPGTPGADDPFMQLFQQMGGMGIGPTPGMPGTDSDIGSIGGMGGLGGLASLAGMAGMGGAGGIPGMSGMGQQVAPSVSRNTLLWKILHSLVAMALALWAINMGSNIFDGSKLQRAESLNLTANAKPRLFWYFATMELLLQSTRFMLEKGRPPQGSMLTTIGNFLPPPFNAYVTTLARYTVFFSTIIADAGVVIFVLGVAAWWNSQV